MEELISVIIPVYKVEEYLDECVLSVIRQTYTNLEIILVDDGSPDNCPRMCDEWATKDSRIKVIHKDNGGVSEARKSGLEAAKGDYIAFVDGDDWIEKNMYSYLLCQLQEQDADIVSCGCVRVGIDTSYSGNIDFSGTPEEVLEIIFGNTEYSVSMCDKLYKREVWDGVYFSRLTIGEDAVVTCQLVSNARKVVKISTPLYYYRLRENSAMTSAFSKNKMDEEEAWRCNYQFIEKNYPQLSKKAFDFYLQKVNVMVCSMNEADRKTFAKQYQQLCNILKNNFWYVVWGSQLNWKSRIKLALDILKQ